MEVSEALKRFRKRLGLTQGAVAESLGIHRQAYQPYETGKVTPSVPMIIKMADTFNVSTDYLLGRSDTPNPIAVGTDEVEKARALREKVKELNEMIKNVIEGATT